MALVIRVWNQTAGKPPPSSPFPVLQPGKRSHRGGVGGLRGVLHNVWFSLAAYLLITAITMAALVCLFAREDALVCLHPADRCRRVSRASGEGTLRLERGMLTADVRSR